MLTPVAAQENALAEAIRALLLSGDALDPASWTLAIIGRDGSFSLRFARHENRARKRIQFDIRPAPAGPIRRIQASIWVLTLIVDGT